MNESTQLNELFGALSKAQAEYHTAEAISSNPFYKSKYAPLDIIVKASRPALTKYGLAVVQSVQVKDNGQQVLLSILGHSSGQCLSSEMIINPIKNDPQGLGSCITYLRRYCYAALVGVVVGEEDDDGNAASDKKPNKPTFIHPDDADHITSVLLAHPEKNTDWLNRLGIKKWSQLTADKVDVVLEQLEKLSK